MDPKDFLVIAKDLLKKDKVVNYRTAFNRSYYAAYNMAVNLLKKSGVRIPENATGHGQVNIYLGNCGIRDLEETQSKLTNLRGDRNKADYKLKDKTVEKRNNAIKAVSNAELIIKTFDLHSSQERRKKIAEGIKIYNKKINSASKSPT